MSLSLAQPPRYSPQIVKNVEEHNVSDLFINNPGWNASGAVGTVTDTLHIYHAFAGTGSYQLNESELAILNALLGKGCGRSLMIRGSANTCDALITGFDYFGRPVVTGGTDGKITSVTAAGAPTLVRTSAAAVKASGHSIGIFSKITGCILTANTGAQNVALSPGTRFGLPALIRHIGNVRAFYLDNTVQTISSTNIELFQRLGNITSGTDSGAAIVVTLANHGIQNGDIVEIAGVTGNTAANGVWVASNVTATTVALTYDGRTPVVGNGTFASGTIAVLRGMPFAEFPIATASGAVQISVG